MADKYLQELPPFDVRLDKGSHMIDLRDHFAARAMQTLLLNDGYDFSDRKVIAETAYAYADAMLEARTT
jgi:hypothetical protein